MQHLTSFFETHLYQRTSIRVDEFKVRLHENKGPYAKHDGNGNGNENVTKQRFEEQATAVHVRYKSLYILCHPLQNNDVKWSNSALFGEREPQRLILRISIWNRRHS